MKFLIVYLLIPYLLHILQLTEVHSVYLSGSLNPFDSQMGTLFASSKNSWYYDNWCGHCYEDTCLQYLDDAYCQKVFPSDYQRDLSCPIDILNEPPSVEGYVTDTEFDDGFLYMSKLPVDTTSLVPYVNNGANLCLIVSKRVQNASDSLPRLYSKYFCAGNSSLYDSYETWSSSKIVAIANAAGHLRSNETNCNNKPIGIGINSLILESKKGSIPFGDLATIIASYDTTAGYSSNALSSYFHDIGWRERANWLITDWLGAVPNAQPQSLGGNYGESTPSDLGFTISEFPSEVKPEKLFSGKASHNRVMYPDMLRDSFECTADKDPWPTVYSNTLSALSSAELLRRIVLHQSLSPALKFPGVKNEDILVELFGAEDSILFPGLQWGGLTTDTSIFLQKSLNMTEVDLKSEGQWRIFSKLGAGYSTSRSKGEIITTAYACLPDTLKRYSNDKIDSKLSTGSYEFILSARGSVDRDYTLINAEKIVFQAVDNTIKALLNGNLPI